MSSGSVWADSTGEDRHPLGPGASVALAPVKLRWLPIIVLAGVLAAACSQSDGGDGGSAAPEAERQAPPSADSADPAPEEAGPVPDEGEPRPASDRIVLVDGDQLATVLPDGSDLLALTTPDGHLNLLPTWSPDATRIAWTRVDPANATAEIATSRFDQSAMFNAAVETPPFYYYWDPASKNLAYLSPSVGGIDLGVLDVSGEGEPTRVDRGQPYYFSWSPDGDEILVHASGLRLDRIDLDGSTVIIDELPGAFQAPTWTPDARALVFATRTDDGDVLVSSGTDGEGRLELGTYEGYLTFAVSPGTNRIAVQVVDASDLADPGVVTASAPRTQPAGPAPEIPPGGLYVVATFGGELVPVSSEPATAFFWSPDGQGLAWLEPATLAGELWYQWFFLTPNGLLDGPVFRPSDTLLTDYLPFFDQFAKSITFWSPAGDQFVFAGTSVDGESGVFVHEVAAGGATIRIADGEFAAWSPTVAGDAAASAL